MTTDESQTTKMFLKTVNKVLCTDLRCILCDSSFGEYGIILSYVHFIAHIACGFVWIVIIIASVFCGSILYVAIALEATTIIM